jgi:hypothetical protein
VSIIYDALQKTQRARTENREFLPEKNNFHLLNRIINVVVKIAVVVLAVMIAYIYLPMISRHFSLKQTHTHVAAATTAPVIVERAAPVEAVAANQQSTETVASAETVAAAGTTAAPGGLSLTGVMLAGQNSVAIINNHSYQLGDMINGMKVIGIEINKVQLLNGQQIVVLRSAG